MILIKNFIFENFKGLSIFFFGFDFAEWGEIDHIFLGLTIFNEGDRSYFLLSTFKGRKSTVFFFNKSQMACCFKLFFIMAKTL